ncbi:hypothetical protein MTO96_048229 [Rhipicephalus appendiculatus]
MMQYMKALSKNKIPDVIALQEPYDHAKLPGYVTHSPLSDRTGRDIKMIVEEQASNRKVRIVEWDKFRKTRDREKKEGPIEDIGAWCKEILADVEKATKEIEWMDWREKEAGGFVQAGTDINGLVDGVLAHISEPSAVSSSSPVSFADLEDSSTNMYASPIAFEPALMDFKSQPLSMPVRRRVVVKNLSPESSIEMLSISGNTANFHCSFFQEKRISPGGNTTFDIVYLGRERGLVENILFIHTSLGSFKYQVSAIGKENPYRSTIQLTEIYTSGGDLHLEMPDGENKISKELWEIPPYKTKPVMKANFVSRIEKNHTAFIRIKLNSTTRVDLILPVEVEVVSLPGIFSPTETLDFGVMHSQDEPRTLPLNLLNSGPKQLYISNVIVTPVNEAVESPTFPQKLST